MIQKINTTLHTPLWLLFLFISLFALRIPTLFESYFYNSEITLLSFDITATIGLPLYTNIYTLFSLIAREAGNLFALQVILTLWHLMTVFVFWKLITRMFPKNLKLPVVGTLVFSIFTTIPLFEGNVANKEMFMIGPTMLAFYLTLAKKTTNKILFQIGLLLSISTLFSLSAIFDSLAIFAYLLTTRTFTKTNRPIATVQALYFGFGFLTPILFLTSFVYMRATLHEQTLGLINLTSISLPSFTGDINREIFNQSLQSLSLQTRIIFVTLGLVSLYSLNKKLSKQFILVTVWIMLTLFSFTVSEPQFSRSLIQSIAPLSILVAILFSSSRMTQLYAIIPIFIFIFTPFFYSTKVHPTFPYYQRFIQFVTSNISQDTYRHKSGTDTNRKYSPPSGSHTYYSVIQYIYQTKP